MFARFNLRLVLSLTAGLAAVGATALPRSAAAHDAPAVAAAADLKFALEEIAGQFRSDSGKEVRLVFGSSGNFTSQLQQGAPFQMFLSADESFVFQLADAGKTLDRGALYAEGRIVLFAPHGSPLTPDADFAGLRQALSDGKIQRFAIANPEHAPYGHAAQEALQHQGLWTQIEPKLVLGENVSQTAQFASSGSAQGGIFAYSLALAPQVAALGSYALIPTDRHSALRQRMVLMRNAGDVAKAFYAFVQTPAARTIFRKYGFVLPGEGA